MNAKNKLLVSISVIAILLGLAIYTEATFGDTFDTATGSFTLNAAPTVSNVDFVNGTYELTTYLIPDDLSIWGVNFTVDTSATMTNLLNVTVYIFDDSVHGSDYLTATPDGIQLTRAVWVEATDTWTIAQGSLSQWTEQSSVDPGTGSSDTSFEFCFRFDISKAARYDTDWNVSVYAYDDDAGVAEYGFDSETALVTMNQHFEVSFSTPTFSWGEVEPESVNNTHGALVLTIYANADWELQINATDFSASGESDVDIEANNIIAWDEDGSPDGNSLWIRNTLTTGLGSWDAQSPMSTEAGFTRNVYIFLSTGTFFNAGVGKVWSTTILVLIQANV